MKKEENLQKLQEIFRDIIDDESLVLTESYSTQDNDDWDSVAMVQILLAVEAEFGVKFSTDEVANIKSVNDILKKITT